MEITACFDNSRAGFWLHAAIECEEQFCRGSFICPPRVIHLAFIQTAVDKHREADTGDPERMRGRRGSSHMLCDRFRGCAWFGAARKRAALRPRPHHEKSQWFGSDAREPRLPASLVLVRRVAILAVRDCGCPVGTGFVEALRDLRFARRLCMGSPRRPLNSTAGRRSANSHRRSVRALRHEPMDPTGQLTKSRGWDGNTWRRR